MLDRELIQHRGFANVIRDESESGFELRLRMPSYRGMWANLIDGVDVTVDGHTWPASETRWIFDDVEYSLAEIQRSSGVRWQLEDAARVYIPAGSGLEVGVHDVSVVLKLRMSYIPIEYQPTEFTSSRKVTIVR